MPVLHQKRGYQNRRGESLEILKIMRTMPRFHSCSSSRNLLMAATSSWCRVPSYNHDFLSVQLSRKRKKSHEARALYEKAVLWICFGFNADPDPGIQHFCQCGSGSRVSMTKKIGKKFKAEKIYIYFFNTKNWNLLIPMPP
jgi:hypothetical protein